MWKRTKLCPRNKMLALGPKTSIIGDFIIIFNLLEKSLHSHRYIPKYAHKIIIQTHFQEKVMFKHRTPSF